MSSPSPTIIIQRSELYSGSHMSSYNITRFTRQILKRHRKQPPSLILHLYPTHFRFEHQHGNYSYDSPMKCFLEAIREQKLPTDLLDVLDQAKVRYYNGCLIVEVHDHRSAAPAPSTATTARMQQLLSLQLSHTRDQPSTSKAEVYRIVLAPNPATLWTELGIMNQRGSAGTAAPRRSDQGHGADERIEENDDSMDGAGWTEEEAVELEARILARTAPPLCLDPSLQTTRIANVMLRATTLRPPKKRKRGFNASGDAAAQEEEMLLKKEREERERMMRIGDEGVGRGRGGNAFSRLSFIQNYRERSNPGPSSTTHAAVAAPSPVPPAVPTPTPTPFIRLIASVSGPSSATIRTNAPSPIPASIAVAVAGSPTPSENGRTIARIKKKKTAHGEAESVPSSAVPLSATATSFAGSPTLASASTSSSTPTTLIMKKLKKKSGRADSPDMSIDSAEKKKKAAEKKSNSKARQEKKRKEAEAAISAGSASSHVVS